ncbi:MAG: hypothetical protein BRC37_11875 [Cyanobacteria bacterium QH_3_48_40]|nr:MAG: hypothetical protein BRC37_11875 [Cyanobacteria bacterium QH_3_48_40]
MPVSGGRFGHSHSLYSGSPVAAVLLKCRLAIGLRHAHSHAATTARDRHCLGLTQSQAFGCPGSLAAPEDFLLTGAFVAIGSLFLLKITLPRPVWRKLWHDGIEKVLRSGLSLLGRLVGRSLRRF